MTLHEYLSVHHVELKALEDLHVMQNLIRELYPGDIQEWISDKFYPDYSFLGYDGYDWTLFSIPSESIVSMSDVMVELALVDDGCDLPPLDDII